MQNKEVPDVVWKVNKRQKWVTFFYRQPKTNKYVKVRVRSYNTAGLKVVCRAAGVKWERFASSISFAFLLSQYIRIVTFHIFRHADKPSCLINIIENIVRSIVTKMSYDLNVTLLKVKSWT